MTNLIQRVVIRCPNTGEVVNTVLRLRSAAFETLSTRHSFRCDRCNEIHSWGREDAWLEDVGRRVGAGQVPVGASTRSD